MFTMFNSNNRINSMQISWPVCVKPSHRFVRHKAEYKQYTKSGMVPIMECPAREKI